MTENRQKQSGIDLYVIDTVHEHTTYDVFRRYAVDKETFERYFPDWNYKSDSKPRLQPRRKKAWLNFHAFCCLIPPIFGVVLYYCIETTM